MTDKKVETPKKYKCEYCGEEDDLLINASFHYCESEVLINVIDACRAELERVKGERDECRAASEGISRIADHHRERATTAEAGWKNERLLKRLNEKRAEDAEAERDELKTRLHGEHDAHMDCHKKLEAAEAALASANACIREVSRIITGEDYTRWLEKHAAAIKDAALRGEEGK